MRPIPDRKRKEAILIIDSDEEDRPTALENLELNVQAQTEPKKPKAKRAKGAKRANPIGGGLPKGVNNIDNLHSDPRMCSSYAEDIFRNMQKREAKLLKRYVPDYMERVQTEVDAGMRAILVDWLVEVAEYYNLVPDTLYMTVSLLDQYLSANHISRKRFQLLGVTCMLIASKYEEVYGRSVAAFCYITDDTYTKQQVVEMEKSILNHFNFDISFPTIETFLRRFIRAGQSPYKAPSLEFEYLGDFLAELTLLEYSFLQFLPSLIAASAVFLARVALTPYLRPWTVTLQHYSGYKASQLETCVRAVHELYWKKGTLKAIQNKYKQHEYKCIADLELPMLLKSELFDDSQVGS